MSIEKVRVCRVTLKGAFYVLDRRIRTGHASVNYISQSA